MAAEGLLQRTLVLSLASSTWSPTLPPDSWGCGTLCQEVLEAILSLEVGAMLTASSHSLGERMALRTIDTLRDRHRDSDVAAVQYLTVAAWARQIDRRLVLLAVKEVAEACSRDEVFPSAVDGGESASAAACWLLAALTADVLLRFEWLAYCAGAPLRRRLWFGALLDLLEGRDDLHSQSTQLAGILRSWSSGPNGAGQLLRTGRRDLLRMKLSQLGQHLRSESSGDSEVRIAGHVARVCGAVLEDEWTPHTLLGAISDLVSTKGTSAEGLLIPFDEGSVQSHGRPLVPFQDWVFGKIILDIADFRPNSD
jgi:hypothetical protein